MIRVAINGAAGRMGRRLVALAGADEGLKVVAGLEREGHDLLGRDVGEVAGVDGLSCALTVTLSVEADVLIDFTTAAAMRAALDACASQRTTVVIGTTGLSDDDHRAIDVAGQSIAVLQAPNMSLGVNLLFSLCGRVAKQLGDDYDIEVTEIHHRFKRDAPSGTAWGIAQAICESTGKSLEGDVVHGRRGGDVPRKRGEIGMHALRMGDVIGEHTVSFAGLGERLELRHVATDRDVFVRGALVAAKWLARRPAGRYTMSNVLGL